MVKSEINNEHQIEKLYRTSDNKLAAVSKILNRSQQIIRVWDTATGEVVGFPMTEGRLIDAQTYPKF